jgi:hypothetical protein
VHRDVVEEALCRPPLRDRDGHEHRGRKQQQHGVERDNQDQAWNRRYDFENIFAIGKKWRAIGKNGLFCTKYSYFWHNLDLNIDF